MGDMGNMGLLDDSKFLITQEFNKIVDEIIKFTTIETKTIPEPKKKIPIRKKRSEDFKSTRCAGIRWKTIHPILVTVNNSHLLRFNTGKLQKQKCLPHRPTNRECSPGGLTSRGLTSLSRQEWEKRLNSFWRKVASR